MAGKRSRKQKRDSDDFFSNLNADLPSIEIPELDFGSLGYEKNSLDPNKLSKPQLVSILASELSSDELYHMLISLGKHTLAERFKNEVEEINKRYQRKIDEIKGKVEEESLETKLLKSIEEEIVRAIRKVYSLNLKVENEHEFKDKLHSFLAGVASTLEESLLKFGLDVKVYREYPFPSNERIDLLIKIGNNKIGVELKYDLSQTSQLQRLLGQIDRYIQFIDSLIVLSYFPLSSTAIKEIKKKESEKGKRITVVTQEQIW